MKKFFVVILAFILSVNIVKAAVLPFSQGFDATVKTPLLVLVYAQWADNSAGVLQTFRNIQNKYGTQFNYTELDIATPDAKAFNQKFHIYPNLPYILMFRDGGKVSRYIQKDCANDFACIDSKLKTFIQ
ncbi:hypothetical protein IJD34_02565 [bacterium]|nr:hypothetical protein [bacterium]